MLSAHTSGVLTDCKAPRYGTGGKGRDDSEACLSKVKPLPFLTLAFLITLSMSAGIGSFRGKGNLPSSLAPCMGMRGHPRQYLRDGFGVPGCHPGLGEMPDTCRHQWQFSFSLSFYGCEQVRGERLGCPMVCWVCGGSLCCLPSRSPALCSHFPFLPLFRIEIGEQPGQGW